MTQLTFHLAAWTLAVGSLMGQSGPSMSVTVPFNFMAGEHPLPAGEYTVHTDASKLVWIHAVKLDANAILFSQSVPVKRSENGAGLLTFNKYGDRYFLAKISAGDTTGNELPKSRAEREYVNATLLAKKAKPAIVVVAAR